MHRTKKYKNSGWLLSLVFAARRTAARAAAKIAVCILRVPVDLVQLFPNDAAQEAGGMELDGQVTMCGWRYIYSSNSTKIGDPPASTANRESVARERTRTAKRQAVHRAVTDFQAHLGSLAYPKSVISR